MKNKNKVFVTGATGFLGSNLVRKLIDKGKEVNGLVFGDTYNPLLENTGMNVCPGDVLDYSSLLNSMKDCSEVYHTAGLVSYSSRDNKKMKSIHVNGTENIMNAALELGVEKIVYTSSTAAVGFAWNPKPLNEKNKWRKRHNRVGYMHTKRLGEETALSYSAKGLDVVSVNPTSFFGRGDINMNEGEIFKRIKQGKLNVGTPGGISVVSIDDVVDGHLLAMEKGKSGERYILANEQLLIADLFNLVRDEMNVERVDNVMGRAHALWLGPVAWGIEKACDFLGYKTKISPDALSLGFGFRFYDSSKARKELGWEPKVPIRKAITEAREFYEEYGLI